MSNIKHLSDLLKVCSILPALAIMPAMAAEYISGDIEQYPYTVKAGDSLLVTSGVSNAENGVFHNNGSLTISDNLVFADNNTKGYGATIYLYNKNATHTKIGNNVLFSGGTALEGTSPDYDGMGGAIYSWSDGGKDGASGANVIEMGNNVTFRGNSAVDGSVIYTHGYNTITIGDNLVVEDNSSAEGYGAIVLNGYDAFYGNDFINTMHVGKNALFKNNIALLRSGAVYIVGDANDKAVFDDGAQFIGNSSSFGGAVAGFGTFEFGDVSFVSNVSYNAWERTLKDAGWSSSYNGHVGNGGAVLNRGDFVVNGEAVFLNNYAEGFGGAIYNGGQMTLARAEFEGNSSEKNGGAIYNSGTLDLSKASVEFENNVAAVSGGAIYNTGDLTIKNGDFENNKITSGDGDGGALYTDTGALTLVDTDFSGNYAKENAEGNLGYGGAIYAQGGTIDIKGGEFDANHALTGGAIYVSKSATSVNIENVEFEGNWASDIGALGIFGKNTTLNNLKFTNNRATGEFDANNDGGGALFFGAVAQAKLTGSHFAANESASVAGAIATRNFAMGLNTNAVLDIDSTTFVNNKAAEKGGAFDNYFYHSEINPDAVYVANSSFHSNSAKHGGAIYNHGAESADGLPEAQAEQRAAIELNNVEFVGNNASAAGGAIFNETGATVILSGNNKFANNVAGKGANDIYNDGVLNITGGSTIIDGGILGNGTLTLAQGATLDIANTTVKQSVINIDGTVALSVVSNRSYGRLVADDLNVSDTAKLQLSVGGVGEYNIFDGNVAGFKNITYGDSYLVEELDNGYIKVTTKSVEDLAADTGLTTQAAGAVASLANSHSDKMQNISLALQEALNSGDKEFVEQESKKLNPEDKPVVQSIASSVQNQVLSLATGRMAGGAAMGRAGGDESQENGFWMHGLFNKSKMDGQFHGYTRGVAFGMDTVIDGKYTLGGGLAFNNSDVHSDGRGSTDIDSKTLFMYGQYKPSEWFVNAALTYTMSEYDGETAVAGVKVNDVYDVDSYGAQIMGGYDFNTGITAEAGVRYLHIAQDEYTKESGAEVAATDTDFLTSVAGLKYAFAIENDWEIQLKPELRAALTYDLISESDVAVIDMPGVASYKVDADRLNRLGGEFGIGLTADYKGLKVTLMYDLDLHKDYTSQTGIIKFRTQF